MENPIYLTEYVYTGITGQQYTPYNLKGRWYVIPHRECTFFELIYLCRIPDEEAVILKLKYGVQSKEPLL